MRNSLTAGSSASFIAKLSPLERMVYESFSSCQRSPGLGAFCVFRDSGNGANFMGVPSDSPLSAHIEWNMQEDGRRYKSLLMALDLDRSFESQWPCEPGELSKLDRFTNAQLICARGLDDCKAVDQKTAIGDGLRRSALRLVSSTEVPRSFSFGTKPKPELKLIQGFRP